ncbi:MAG: hypothetical protein U0797_09105 [Gemmataceae bacterium]
MRRTVLLLALIATLGAAPPTPKAPPEPPKPKQDSPRLQKLKALTFDRRPSSVLKAWAPAAPAKKDAPKPDSLTMELEHFQRVVTLGRWDEVKFYLSVLPKAEAKAAYQQMLNSLQMNPMMAAMGGGGGDPAMMMMRGNPAAMQYAEKNQFAPDDVVGLAAACPYPIDRDDLDRLGGILRACLSTGTVVEAVVKRFQAEAAKKGPALTARHCARLLAVASEPAQMGPFLPKEEVARKGNDFEALNLLSQLYLGKYEEDKKLAWLEQAWSALQAVLAAPAVAEHREEQIEALKHAVDLAPRLKEELGQRWLEESFTKEPGRGKTILSTIGGVSAQGIMMQMQSPEPRLKTLRLQKTAVEALLKASPGRAKDWHDTLTLLARNWLREAEVTYQFAEDKQSLRRDRYGNYFYWDDFYFNPNRMQNPNQPKAISTEETLLARPGPEWLERVNDELRPKLAMVLCQLHLKAEEEANAFPHIEELAKTHPRQARELTGEFLRVWTKNHDPNENKGRTSRYMWMYGFDRRSDGIPLTRSKQERNLVDLAGWVHRMKKLPVGEIDEELLAKAFTACHSSAEVYKAEAIERVFGPIGGLKPKVLSGLAQQMRENLAGVWKRPEEQKDKKTNRKTKDIQSEVKRGYAVALDTVETAMKKFPADWSLACARAAILHDEVNFQSEIAKSSDYTPRRLASYKEFERAAGLYAKAAKDLPEDEQTTKVYEQWMYASLGAVDLGQVNEEKVPDTTQPERIRKAILALPGELSKKHMEKFANQLFNRMSSVKPQVKYRYLKAGFDVVGDHKEAAEAKKVFDYYKDLVGEIKLEAKIDGPSDVGHKKPFGVFVWLKHTRDIERESGGFGRYLQNQNTGTYFSWNYGRPTADYRDRFQTAANEALKEHFDVVSVTFETDKVHSRAVAGEYGWRFTPYAYLLLKPKGPQVDKLPPLRMDLDFLDTSGYVVLPIESAAVPLAAKDEVGPARPAKKVEVTQILDERQAGQGKLILEVKASALGLVPDLDQVLDLKPEGFEVAKVVDQGAAVSKFDEDSEQVAVRSERVWMVTLKAQEGLTVLPTKFAFGTAKGDVVEKMEYQRYDDADLAKVDAVVELERSYGRRSLAWLWAAGGGTLVVLLGGVLAWRRLRNRRPAEVKWKLPEPLTPFTAIALLERIEREGGLSESQRQELTRAIRGVERHYFAQANGETGVDLKTLTEGWVRRAR